MPMPCPQRTQRHAHPRNDPSSSPTTPDAHGKHQEHLLPQLTDLCRALRTGLTNSPHRELLWKGAWTTNLIASFEDTARANTRNNPWRSPLAISLLTKALKSYGTITTTFVLNAWKLRRRAAFQIHKKSAVGPRRRSSTMFPACHT